MAVLLKSVGEERVDGGSFLGVAMGADVSSWLVDHPQLSDRLLQLQSLRCVRLEVCLYWDEHILEDPLSVDPDEAELDKIFGLPAGAERLETHPLGETNGLRRV